MLSKITLIEPKAPSSHVYSMVNMPRLGLPLIGSHLQSLGYEVNLIYGSSDSIRMADIANSDLVGISTTTSTAPEAYRIARYASERRIPVVLGGVHATFMVEEALENGDYVCRGEADFTFGQLLDHLKRGEVPLTVPGVSFYHQGRLINNPLPEPVNLETCAIPDLTLFSNSDSFSTYPVMTSRGCPFNCTFCSVTAMFGRKYRCRSIEQVLEELAPYVNKSVFFCDDNFAANRSRTKELLRGMIDRQVIPEFWGAQVRTDAARDEELLDLMQQAGCKMVYVGFESINPLTLESFNKMQGVSDIEYCIEKFHEYGIMLHGMFVFGGDDDTVKTINDTVDFALDNRIDTAQFLFLTPLPGTSTFQQMEAENRLLTRDWSLYDGHHVVFRPRLMSPLELQVETMKGFRRFYSARNLLDNLLLTGKQAVAFRAAGYYLTRKWERENGWYYKALERQQEGIRPQQRGFELQKTIESFKQKLPGRNKPQETLDLRVCEIDGGFRVELIGYLNKFNMKKAFRMVRNALPETHMDLTISINQLNFDSEEVFKQFVQEVNRLSAKVRSVYLKVGMSRSRLNQVLEKYNLGIPYFELS